jgi:hypothetical protein
VLAFLKLAHTSGAEHGGLSVPGPPATGLPRAAGIPQTVCAACTHAFKRANFALLQERKRGAEQDDPENRWLLDNFVLQFIHCYRPFERTATTEPGLGQGIRMA